MTLPSLLLCAATIGIWVGGPAGFVRLHGVQNADGSVTNREAWFTVAQGGLAYCVLGQHLPPYDPRFPAIVPLRFFGRGEWQRVGTPTTYPYVRAPAGCLDSWQGWGVQFAVPVRAAPPKYYTDGYRMVLPAPFLAALTAVLPTIRVFRALRHPARPHAGCCRRCVYDLRATPEQCRECGTVVTVGGRKR